MTTPYPTEASVQAEMDRIFSKPIAEAMRRERERRASIPRGRALLREYEEMEGERGHE